MRAWRLAKFASEKQEGVESLVLEHDVPIPSPRRGEVRVRVKHASVNPVDSQLLMGMHQSVAPVALPYTVGLDVSGVVDSVGEDVEGVEGMSVVAYLGLTETCSIPPPHSGCCGAFAEYVVVPFDRVARIGADADARALAGIGLAGLTAQQALFGGGKLLMGDSLGNLGEGGKLLVLGGSSATGMQAIQLGKAAGAIVATTASASSRTPQGESKAALVQRLGADVVVDYRTEAWHDKLAGWGADVIFDCVGNGPEDLKMAAGVLRPGGRFVSIANFDPSSAQHAAFANFLVLADGAGLSHLVALVADGKLKVLIDSVWKFEEAKDALMRSLTGRATGKIIIDVAP